MTRLPTDSWNVTARPDLPAYELNELCPVTGLKYGLEDHHLWRRSFGKDFRDAWWVELEDGTVVPNRVNLSQDAHGMVTRNEARIEYEDGTFWWCERDKDLPFGEGFAHYDRISPLAPQPGPPMQLDTEGGETPWNHVTHSHVDEEPCPRCKGAGKVTKKPKSQEPLEARPKATVSIRVPKDHLEDGAEVLGALIDALVQKFVDAGRLESTKGGAYHALVPTLFVAVNDWDVTAG